MAKFAWYFERIGYLVSESEDLFEVVEDAVLMDVASRWTGETR